MLFRSGVGQVLPEPSLNLSDAHPFAFAVVGDLITVDLAEAEISRLRMGGRESTPACTGPHRKRRGDQHYGVRLHIEQRAKWTLLRVIRTRRITRSRPDPPVLLLDEIRVAQTFFTTVTPFIPHSFVQAFGKRFCQAVG